MNFRSSSDNLRTCADIRAWGNPVIQSQYSASPTIKALAQAYWQDVAPYEDLTLFYQSIFDLDTATGVGLDIWGRVVGIGRDLTVDENVEYFGFYGTGAQPFGQGGTGTFYLTKATTDYYSLTDVAYRKMIYWKAMANISDAAAATLNRLMQALLDISLPVYVLETGVMTIRVVMETSLSAFYTSIIRNYGLMAKGAAVGLEWLVVPTPVFGFDGTGLQPFGQAPFFHNNIIYPFTQEA